MTSERQKHRIWQKPWQYLESIAVVSGIVIIGIILQLTVGSFNFYLLTSPVNYYVLAIIILLIIVMGVVSQRNSFLQWFSGIPMSVSLLCALLLQSIIMGLIPQGENSNSLFGFDVMTRHWGFVLVYTITLLSMGTLIVRRFVNFKLRDYGFYFNHLGLWLLLLFSGLGYADMERYVMYVNEGKTEWRVYDDQNNIKELPIAIQLNDFDMDVYPPKLAIIDRNTGDVQPINKPQYFQIDADISKGKLDGWEIEIKEYIHQAVRNSDSTYKEVPMPGSTPAVYVIISKDSIRLNGWICGGNQAQIYMTLPLNEKYSMVMTTAEPRSFTSNIEIYTKKGEVQKAVLEVNKPLRTGSWTIYQYGYDNNAGRLSSYSSFELVYDPWIIPIYIGVIMMMMGSVCMIWTGKKMKKNDME